ncbi:MAG: ribonuclease D [Proteobacteria bacterium]|nr:ribonuclease D [Pseudomonadota bacterium]
MLITTSEALVEFCESLRGVPYIAVDTEFMREKSYYAKLCLVQVAHGEHVAAIDPLAPDIDLAPLGRLLNDPSIVKVLHSAVQDLEIFLLKTGSVPAPVFDTQIAAAVCGLGDQPGYAKLVASMLNVEIDKSSQMTDWSLRPLSDRQLHYALGDVTHLCKVYDKLVARLEAEGRLDWVSEEMLSLTNPERYGVTPSEAWRRIKLRRPKRKTLAVLQALAQWREEEAMHHDVPRGWVARDDALVEIAQNLPRSADELARVRSMKVHIAKGEQGAAMLEIVRDTLETPEDSWPEVPRGHSSASPDPATIALLQTLLQLRCQENDVAKALVVKRHELDRIATEREPDVPCLAGWRRRVFGADALELMAGRLSLTVRKGVVVELRSEE